MPRNSKDADQEVRVIIDQPFTYRLDASRERTLPTGWRGRVPGDIADEIEDTNRGRREEVKTAKASTAPKKSAKAGGKKVAAKPKDSSQKAPAAPKGEDQQGGDGQTGGSELSGASETGSTAPQDGSTDTDSQTSGAAASGDNATGNADPAAGSEGDGGTAPSADAQQV